MSQQIVSTWDGVQNTNSWVHDGDVERSAVDIVELASSVAGYSAGAQAAADAASGYADTASAAVASIGTAATDAVAAVQDEGAAQISALVDAGGVQSALIGSAGAAQIADIVTSGGIQISSVGSAGSAQIAAIMSAGGAQVALVSAAGGSAIGDLAAVTAAQSAALVSAGGYQSGLIATAGSAQITAVQAEGGTQIAAVQLAASAQVNSATVAAMSALSAVSTAQGAASAASGYAVSAGSFATVTSGYMVSAGGYATSAGSAADAASGYALTASSYMTSAGGYASAASDSADAAAASAASIAGEVEQIGINTKNISTIQSLLNGALSTQQTDATAAYAKTVPSKAQGYAAIESIGGKTVVWNQLCFNGTSPVTVPSGITYTISGTDVTVSGTATGASVCFVNGQNATPFIQGHKYLMYGAPSGSSNQTYFMRLYFDSYVAEDTGNGVIWTATGSGLKTGVAIFVVSGTVISTAVKFSPHLVDLTLMFGSGNEPSTVAEFQQMFPTIDPAYNAGSLISAGVTGAVSVGVNLWDEEWALGQYNAGTQVVQKYDDTTHIRNKNPIPVNEGVTYYFNSAGYNTHLIVADSAGNVLYRSTSLNDSTFTVPAGGQFVYFNMAQAYGTTYNHDICINVSNAAINGTYHPYQSYTLPIPAAVQALPGYGWSAGNVYNEVDFERKIYTQRVGSVNLGNLNWAVNSSRPATHGTRFDVIIGDKRGKADDGWLTSWPFAVLASTQEIIDAVAADTICYSIRAAGYTQISFVSSSATTSAQVQEQLAGYELIYTLKTNVETDISSLLSDDNLIQVEPGGTVSFPSVLGDDYRLPVPSDVEYTIDLAPDTPSTDGTYTLQCTVADGVATYEWVSA